MLHKIFIECSTQLKVSVMIKKIGYLAYISCKNKVFKIFQTNVINYRGAKIGDAVIAWMLTFKEEHQTNPYGLNFMVIR